MPQTFRHLAPAASPNIFAIILADAVVIWGSRLGPGVAMNRKQRRMAARQGKQSPGPPGATIDASVRIAELLTTALRHHQAGQLAEAEGYYAKILAIDQNHSDSLHLLGVIAHQVGRNDTAVDLIRKAIALNGRNPAFHNHIGLALDALGHTEDAVVHYREAIALRPNYFEAQNNLGATLHAQRKLTRQ